MNNSNEPCGEQRPVIIERLDALKRVADECLEQSKVISKGTDRLDPEPLAESGKQDAKCLPEQFGISKLLDKIAIVLDEIHKENNLTIKNLARTIGL